MKIFLKSSSFLDLITTFFGSHETSSAITFVGSCRTPSFRGTLICRIQSPYLFSGISLENTIAKQGLLEIFVYEVIVSFNLYVYSPYYYQSDGFGEWPSAQSIRKVTEKEIELLAWLKAFQPSITHDHLLYITRNRVPNGYISDFLINWPVSVKSMSCSIWVLNQLRKNWQDKQICKLRLSCRLSDRIYISILCT